MLWIVVYVRFYLPYSNCGSDHYLHRVLKWLQNRGHRITVLLGSDAKGVPYEYDGIEVRSKPLFGIPYFLDCDVVFTQLDFTCFTCNEVKRKPIVWFMHNLAYYGTVRRNKDRVLAVYNSESALKLVDYPNRKFVLPPPVDIESMDVCEGKGNFEGKITLINLNENKGAEVFYKLAELNSDLGFLGVKGSYGLQVVRNLPNVEIIDNQKDIREVYKRTSILLMPSERESWGLTATEASANGIPVICTDLPGLRENMGDAGIYVDRNDIKKWSEMIRKLKGKQEYEAKSSIVKKRAEMHRPDKKLDDFETELYALAKKEKQIKKAEYGNG